MAIVEIEIPQCIVDDLEESFIQGPMLNASGLRLLSEEVVDRINKMRIVIQADEHPPPHFHVKFANENASFRIDTGERLPNVHGLEKFDHNIRSWWSTNRCALIEVWNRTRPTDCQVGPMEVPEECRSPKEDTEIPY